MKNELHSDSNTDRVYVQKTKVAVDYQITIIGAKNYVVQSKRRILSETRDTTKLTENSGEFEEKIKNKKKKNNGNKWNYISVISREC